MKRVRNVWTPTRDENQQNESWLVVVAGLLIIGIPAIFFYAVMACLQ